MTQRAIPFLALTCLTSALHVSCDGEPGEDTASLGGETATILEDWPQILWDFEASL